MNYLTHYFIDRTESVSFKFGAALPDLLRNSHPRLRLNNISRAAEENNQQLNELKKGIHRHFFLDKIFHNSGFFISSSAYLKMLLKEKEFEKKGLRLFFLSHILTEIILDRLILLNESDTALNFYLDLEKTEMTLLNELLKNNVGYDHSRFTEHFERFLKYRFLLSYSETKGIFYAINRISERTGLLPFSDNDFHLFEEVILKAQEKMETEYRSFLSSGIFLPVE